MFHHAAHVLIREASEKKCYRSRKRDWDQDRLEIKIVRGKGPGIKVSVNESEADRVRGGVSDGKT